MFHPIILGIQPVVLGDVFILGKFEGWHRLTIAIDESMPMKHSALKAFSLKIVWFPIIFNAQSFLQPCFII